VAIYQVASTNNLLFINFQERMAVFGRHDYPISRTVSPPVGRPSLYPHAK
jgi:hypothetical protein